MQRLLLRAALVERVVRVRQAGPERLELRAARRFEARDEAVAAGRDRGARLEAVARVLRLRLALKERHVRVGALGAQDLRTGIELSTRRHLYC